jgi:hypothetical protein
VASFLLFATGSWFSLLLVPAGGLGGLALGGLLNRYPDARRGVRGALEAVAQGGRSVLRPLADERLPVRFLLLMLLATALFLATWSIAYAFLPEGLLASGSEVRMMGNEEAAATFWAELGFVIARNLPWVVIIALVNLLLGYPFACLIPLVWVVAYGLILGTNSFAIPLVEPMAPSLAVLKRAGPYEMSAFLLAAAATYPFSRISLPWRKVTEEKSARLRAILPGLLLAGAGVVLAAWREVAMMFAG